MARLIERERIRIPEKRQRTFRSQQDHQDLFVSISEGEAGLMHAPVLWEDEGGTFWLLVGEGRLKVIDEMIELGIPLRHEGEEIPLGMVPYTRLGGLSAVGLYEAEFDENVRRTPLTVAEKASATAHLFELKKMKAAAEGRDPPTISDLSLEIRGSGDGGYATETRKELIVARHLDDEEVRNATSVSAAFNVIKKKETQRKAQALAAQMGTAVQAHGIEVFNADAAEWLAACPAEKFSIILTDPPYGMGAETFGSYEEAGEHFYDDSFEAWQKLMGSVIPELGRVCKPDAHLYLFCDFDRFHALKAMLEACDWNVHRTPLIWQNPTGFRVPWPQHGPQRKYELILYARRGDKKCLKVYPDLVSYTRDNGGLHPAQKPVALLQDLLTRSALPTDEVLDFCAGSGSTAVACHRMRLACTMIEKDQAAYGTILQRVQGLKR